MFENAEIGVEELPEADSVDWQPMDPSFLKRQLTEAAIALTFVVLGIAALQLVFSFAFAGREADISLGWLWMLPVALAVPFIGRPIISVPRIAYAVRERDIIYKSGVFWQTVTAIPFNRIQHVEKSSTPLDRRFNLATLQLFTAGGTGGDLKIHGLPAKTAERLRFFILDKIGTSVEER